MPIRYCVKTALGSVLAIAILIAPGVASSSCSECRRERGLMRNSFPLALVESYDPASMF